MYFAKTIRASTELPLGCLSEHLLLWLDSSTETYKGMSTVMSKTLKAAPQCA